MKTKFTEQLEQQHSQGTESVIEPVITETEYSYGGDFLKNLGENVTDEQRSMLEPLIKQWDAGITRRFQELQGELKNYEVLKEAELTDPSDIETLVNLNNMLENDPKGLYELLKEAGLKLDEITEPVIQKPSETSTEIPKELQDKITQMEELLTVLAQGELTRVGSAQEEADSKQLDGYIKLMHDEFGDFNDEYVTLKLGQGKSAKEAIDAWNEVKTSFSPVVESKSAPKVLSGSGGPIVENNDVTKLDRSATKELIVKILENAQKG